MKILLDGSDLQQESPSDLVLVGPGYTLGVEGISLGKGQRDEIDFAADWSSVRYVTQQSETPTIVVGIETAGADYTFELNVDGDGDGQTVALGLDLAKGQLVLNVDGGPAKSNFSLELEMITDKGKQTFKHKGLDVGADQVARFDYGGWKGDKAPLHVVLLAGAGAVGEEEDASDEE